MMEITVLPLNSDSITFAVLLSPQLLKKHSPGEQEHKSPAALVSSQGLFWTAGVKHGL